MYVPAHFAVTDHEVHELLHHHGAADLVTATADGLIATFLPFVFDPAIGDRGALLGHVARNNDQWRRPAIGESLVIVRGPDAYVSPSWYATKAQHGRVVPTWNYVTAHVYGRLVVHDDPAWVESLVRRLTEKHESERDRPWSVDDAPRIAAVGRRRIVRQGNASSTPRPRRLLADDLVFRPPIESPRISAISRSTASNCSPRSVVTSSRPAAVGPLAVDDRNASTLGASSTVSSAPVRAARGRAECACCGAG